ncbi:hypothetical protein P4O66_013123 [Electrophorus voltai]|uniref:Uncharacterized protein n=1 Tax=Electrophorus voltai TaxID=2609070 RepID=A0AAD8ZVK7_9TELE|nr:hypothetical protein P4O66_013123 [Electrophorus voltai]
MKLADSVMAAKTSEGSVKWQLCYDISARTWWMDPCCKQAVPIVPSCERHRCTDTPVPLALCILPSRLHTGKCMPPLLKTGIKAARRSHLLRESIIADDGVVRGVSRKAEV